MADRTICADCGTETVHGSCPNPDCPSVSPAGRIKRALASGNRFRRADVAELVAETDRLHALVDKDLSFRDLETKFWDGTFDLRAVLGDEGGTPATKFLAAIMLHAALGEDGMDEPPNYCSTEIELRPGGGGGMVRACLEVIKPGGRSSHEIRRDLEAKLRDAGIGPEET